MQQLEGILPALVLGVMEEKKNTGGRFPDMRNRELKEQAVAFYQENKIPEVLEKMLNKMYLAKPNDLYGYMVREQCDITSNTM